MTRQDHLKRPMEVRLLDITSYIHCMVKISTEDDGIGRVTLAVAICTTHLDPNLIFYLMISIALRKLS